MNKRTFIKALLAGCVAPAALLRAADDAFKWKAASARLWRVNPEWVDAPYEMVDFYLSPSPCLLPVLRKQPGYVSYETVKREITKQFPGKNVCLLPQTQPTRFDKHGNWIPPMILYGRHQNKY